MDDHISIRKAREILTALLFESALNNTGCASDVFADIAKNRLDTWLNLIPRSNARPVTLCRDCYAYRKDKELARAAYLNPNEYCALLGTEMPEDGFCYYGMVAANHGAEPKDDSDECPNCGADMRPERETASG